MTDHDLITKAQAVEAVTTTRSVQAPRASCRIVIVDDAPEPASAVRDVDGGWTLTYRTGATVEQLQAAVDAVGVPVIIGTETVYEPHDIMRQRPTARKETKAERNRRWRREQG